MSWEEKEAQREMEAHITIVEEAIATERKSHTVIRPLAALCKANHPRAEELCLRLFESKNTHLGRTGIYNLRHLRSISERCIRTLETIIKNCEDNITRSFAAEALFKAKGDAVIPLLEKAFRAGRISLATSDYLRESLARLGRENPQVFALLKDAVDGKLPKIITDDPSATRFSVLYSLMLAGDPRYYELAPGVRKLSPENQARLIFINHVTLFAPAKGVTVYYGATMPSAEAFLRLKGRLVPVHLSYDYGDAQLDDKPYKPRSILLSNIYVNSDTLFRDDERMVQKVRRKAQLGCRLVVNGGPKEGELLIPQVSVSEYAISWSGFSALDEFGNPYPIIPDLFIE